MSEIEKVLEERQATYGDYRDQFQVGYELKKIVREHGRHLHPVFIEAIEMVLTKISRILNGDEYYRDSYVDIIGYTKLMLDFVDTNNEPENAPHQLSENTDTKVLYMFRTMTTGALYDIVYLDPRKSIGIQVTDYLKKAAESIFDTEDTAYTVTGTDRETFVDIDSIEASIVDAPEVYAIFAKFFTERHSETNKFEFSYNRDFLKERRK